MTHFTVLADANVLVPAYVRDFLLQFAKTGVFRVRWTTDIRREVRATLCGPRFGKPEDRIDRLLDRMEENVLQPMVTGYQACIEGVSLPDPDDRHVLAAAIASEVDTILTFNLRDFPADRLTPHGVIAVHPDVFLASQVELAPAEALRTVRLLLERMNSPPLDEAGILDRYRRNGLVETAAELERLLA